MLVSRVEHERVRTKRFVVVMLLLSLSSVYTQRAHFGLGVALTPASFGALPLVATHIGVPVAENVLLRAGLDTVLLANDLGVSAPYTFSVSPGWRGYVGGGPGLVVAYGTAFGLHAALGLGRDLGAFGLFAETQPLAVLGRPTQYFFKFRFGGLVYF